MQIRLNYVDLWYHLPVREVDTQISAGLWHRDHGDKRLIKAFSCSLMWMKAWGPLTYLRRSHVGDVFGRLSPAIPPIGRYPKGNVLARLISGTPLPSV